MELLVAGAALIIIGLILLVRDLWRTDVSCHPTEALETATVDNQT